MKSYRTFLEAQEAAENYFNETFGHNSGVGVESAKGNVIEFYSKNDPGMNDTFSAIVNDGKSYTCKNGGQLQIN